MIVIPTLHGFYKPHVSTTPVGNLSLVGYNNSSFASDTEILSLPAGSVVGDLCIVQDGHAYTPNTISGFTTLGIVYGGNWMGYSAWKILTSSDISTGTITATFSNGWNGIMSLAVFSGFSTGVKNSGYVGNGTSVTSVTGPSVSGITSNDYVLYFGSGRMGGAVSIDQGTILQQFNNSAVAGCLCGGTGIVGTVNPVFTYSVSSLGFYQTVIIIE